MIGLVLKAGHATKQVVTAYIRSLNFTTIPNVHSNTCVHMSSQTAVVHNTHTALLMVLNEAAEGHIEVVVNWQRCTAAKFNLYSEAYRKCRLDCFSKFN